MTATPLLTPVRVTLAPEYDTSIAHHWRRGPTQSAVPFLTELPHEGCGTLALTRGHTYALVAAGGRAHR